MNKTFINFMIRQLNVAYLNIPTRCSSHKKTFLTAQIGVEFFLAPSNQTTDVKRREKNLEPRLLNTKRNVNQGNKF